MQSIFIPCTKGKIQADLYGDFKQPQDTILMAHGLGGEKICGLTEFAEYYHSLGYQVCVFDHRGFGESSGVVKYLVDKNSQLSDWNTVIQYLKQQLNLDAEHLILWGYSFSGAHALSLSAQQSFKAVIANFPHVDGLASLTLYPKKYLLPATLLAAKDLLAMRFGQAQYIPIVAKNSVAVLGGADCYDGYHSLIPEHMAWENEVPARIIATIGLYRPIQEVRKIRHPVLLIGAKNDSLIPIQSTRKTAKRIKQSTYAEENCGHFDLFHEPYRSRILKEHVQFLSAL